MTGEAWHNIPGWEEVALFADGSVIIRRPEVSLGTGKTEGYEWGLFGEFHLNPSLTVRARRSRDDERAFRISWSGASGMGPDEATHLRDMLTMALAYIADAQRRADRDWRVAHETS